MACHMLACFASCLLPRAFAFVRAVPPGSGAFWFACAAYAERFGPRAGPGVRARAS